MTKYRITEHTREDGSNFYTVQSKFLFFWLDAWKYKAVEDELTMHSHTYKKPIEFSTFVEAEMYIKSKGKKVVGNYDVRN